ncbi:MAG: polysaccharide deacetylase family protein [Verrucomicrobia bacterium]|nr:polysaccharide deacetylase family protein [Verrucomicrobiota bacterium]
MKKLLILLLVLGAGFFALKKWSPDTLRKITQMIPRSDKKSDAQEPPPSLPPPEPAPVVSPGSEEPRQTPSATPAPKTVAVDKTAQVVVLCYHRVEGTAGGTLSIAPELFEQHMQRLKDRGIAVISMQDFLAWRRNEKTIPPKCALITIDDGYVSSFEVARPILKKFGYPWTCFIYTKFIGTGGKSISWEQLATLRDEGVEIGAHTATHQNLRDTHGKNPEAFDAWLNEEVIGSKQLIEKKLGVRCAVFAYPEGRYNAKVLDVVKAAGFEASFTVYGQRITHGANAEKIGRYAWYSRRPQDMELALNFSGPITPSESEPPAASELAAAMLLTQPANGDTISDSVPVLKANLGSLGEFDENTLTLRLSGVGPVPAKFDRESKIIEARVPQPLKPGEYTVFVSAKNGAKKMETQWSFKVVPAKGLNATLNR